MLRVSVSKAARSGIRKYILDHTARAFSTTSSKSAEVELTIGQLPHDHFYRMFSYQSTDGKKISVEGQ